MDISSDTKSRTFRPNKNQWWTVFFLALLCLMPFGLLFDSSTPMNRRLPTFLTAFALTFAVFGSLAIYSALLVMRSFLLIDKSGLRWRTAGKERYAAWGEVTNYYEQRKQKGGVSSYVETPSGELDLNDFAADSIALQEMRGLIQSHARDAASTQWQLKERQEAVELPQTFSYSMGDLRFMMLIFFASFFIMPVMIFSKNLSPRASWTSLRDTVEIFSTTYGWPMAALFVATTSAVSLLYPLMFGAITIPLWRATKPRLHQCITASERGLTFTDDGVFIEAKWSEITDFSSVRHGAVRIFTVTTSRGTFDFHYKISNAKTLLRLMEERAPHAPLRDRDGSLENLDRPERRWSSGIVGQGERIFSYRNRRARAMVFLLVSLGLIIALMPFVFALLPASLVPPRRPEFYIPCLLVFPALILWLFYAKSEIRIGESGMRARGPRGETFIAWNEVSEYSHDTTYGFREVRGVGKRIRFWVMLGDIAELQNEIARRAVNAQKNADGKAMRKRRDLRYTDAPF